MQDEPVFDAEKARLSKVGVHVHGELNGPRCPIVAARQYDQLHRIRGKVAGARAERKVKPTVSVVHHVQVVVAGLHSDRFRNCARGNHGHRFVEVDRDGEGRR